MAVTNEIILQVDYAPNPKVIDKRGEWAHRLSKFLDWKEWALNENQCQVFRTDKTALCHVAFRRCGCFHLDCKERKDFPDFARKFLQFICSFEDFGDPLTVERIGVRSQFLTPYDGTFDKLIAAMQRNVGGLTDAASKSLGSDMTVVDIAYPLNLRSSHGLLKTNLGPVTNIEAKHRHFPNRDEDDLPAVGIYFDADYAIKPDASANVLTCKDICNTIDSFSQQSWDMQARFRNLIIER